jgi:hypothetical protein
MFRKKKSRPKNKDSTKEGAVLRGEVFFARLIVQREMRIVFGYLP